MTLIPWKKAKKHSKFKLNGKISLSRNFFQKTKYVDFKAQRSALYCSHGNIILEENVMWEIYNGTDMITLTVSKDRIRLFGWKKEKLFRASLNWSLIMPGSDFLHLFGN